MNARRKTIYPAVLLTALFATALLFSVNALSLTRVLTAHPLEIAALFLYFTVLGFLGIPFVAFKHFGRRDSTDTHITLDIPVFALTFAAYGWFVTALLAFLAYNIAFLRQQNLRDRVLVATSRVPFWAIVGVIWQRFHPPLFAFNFVWACAFIFLWADPLASLRGGRPLRALWSAHLRDATLWSAIAAQVLWAAIAIEIFFRAGAWLGIAVLLPLPLIAMAFRALHRERLASHRMALARDAVWSMLQARDPAAQVNSFLESVHGDAPQETLQIYARLRSEDRPEPLASVGPWPGEARMPLVRRALLELHAHPKERVTVRDSHGVVTAYAIRSGRLLGSLVVHRPAGVPARLPARRYVDVANELAPLLRDVRSVVAARDAASIDSLTGLLNRATIVTLMREQLANVAPDAGCAILLIDVDRFKEVNDTMGHLAGDRCLRAVAETIAQNIRPGDRAGRIGGEEFVVLMPVGAEIAAINTGERLRGAIERCGVTHADGTPVTASIGVAVATVSDTPESLLGRADRALYQAKNEGRNRVVEVGA